MKTIKKIANKIKEFKSFLITSHMNLEGDSLGSQLAMAGLLKQLGKDFVILDHDEVPEHYRFLPGTGLVRTSLKAKNKKFDAAIVLDCPNLKRTGRAGAAVRQAGCIINIDHHVSNEKFGDLNWVEERASSAGEIVYKLFKEMRCEITKNVALYLYIAILTDTGSFNYSNTSSVTHEIVSELLGRGIEPYDVSKSIYENKPLADMKLLGKVLSGLEVTGNGKIAYMVVTKKLFKETGTERASCENFVNFGRSVKGVEVAALFREDIKKRNIFHVSLRSAKKVDVNKIAVFFGGGGHKSASGCTLHGNLKDVKKKVLARMKDAL